MTNDNSSIPEAMSENEIITQRRHKLEKLREQGQAFPNDFHRDMLAQSVHEQYEQYEHESLEAMDKFVKLAGRILLKRVMGKASFIQIQDMSGSIQLYVRSENIGIDVYEEFKTWDLGDIVGAEGTVFKTKTGELSVKVSHIILLTKSLRPLPDKFHGLTDQELRYRQRYLDLIMNPESRRIFQIRSNTITAIRNYLQAQNFLEVETPMMQSLAGGATARPFKTYHNTLAMELYLRVAPELYLKKLVIGGFEKIFELNRNFRNEGVSTRHNPEFTMLEFYQAYANHLDAMDFTENLLRTVAQKILGSLEFIYQNIVIDLSQPFDRLTIKEAIVQFNDHIELADIEDIDIARRLATQLNITVKPGDGLGKIQVEIFEKTVEHQLKNPVFITAYPTEVSPLARKNDKDPDVTDRFELFIAGRELANGFSELNDPEDQAERFHQQMLEKNAGAQETMPYDTDYITALEYGMPPVAGVGIGIDRLVMLFTNSASIRDVLLFPHVRHKNNP